MTLEEIFAATPLVLHFRLAALRRGEVAQTYDEERDDITHEIEYRKIMADDDDAAVELPTLHFTLSWQ